MFAVSFNMVPISAFADHNTAHTIQQLQNQINDLTEQIRVLIQQQQITHPAVTLSTDSISATPVTCDNSGFCTTFISWMTKNASNAIVDIVQPASAANPFLSPRIFNGSSSVNSSCIRDIFGGSPTACVFYVTDPSSSFDYPDVTFNLYDSADGIIKGALLASVRVTKAGVTKVPVVPPSHVLSTKFSKNDSVKVVLSTAHVRLNPAIAGNNSIGTEEIGKTGTVIDSVSVSADGYNWWQIQYSDGFEGWTAEDFLEKYTPSTGGTTQAAPGTVTLAASPNSGTAPLSATLTATVGETFGIYNYYFYCDGGPTPPMTSISLNSGLNGSAVSGAQTATSQCSYSTAGTKTAKVLVIAQPLRPDWLINSSYWRQATVAITVSTPTAASSNPVAPSNPKIDLKVGSSGSVPANHTDGPLSIAVGGTANLSWILTNSAWSSCGFSDGVSVNTSQTTGNRSTNPINNTQTVTLTCYLAGIPYSDSVTINTSQAILSPTVDFSHDNGTLVADKDTWTFTLSNPNFRVGDVVSVRAYKDDKDQGNFFLCKFNIASSCTTTGKPSSLDTGKWSEDILINGVPIGKTLHFVVVPPPAVTIAASPVVTGVTFNFSPNSGRLGAGKDSWNMSVNNLQSQDEVYVDAWKGGAPLGKFKICLVPVQVSPISPLSCGSVGFPQDGDIGKWEEAVIVRRAGVDSVVAGRGAISFEVVKVVAPTVIISPTATTAETCSMSVSATTIPVNGSIAWTVTSNPTGYPFVWGGTDNGSDIGSVPGGTTNFSATYPYGAVASYTRYAVVSLPGAPCITTTVPITVQ